MSDLTEGQRLYAIGDLHGRLDLLREALTRIEGDLSARPHPRHQIIFLGDYVDRGPDSRGVIDTLIGLRDAGARASFLLGNHDSYVAAYLQDPDWFDRSYHWLHSAMGGAETLASYGVSEASEKRPSATRDAFAEAFPPEHLAFLQSCALWRRVGGYVFAHAGIRPGIALESQRREDCIWIREPFLSDTRNYGFKVVHGHTIVPQVEHRRNRIAIDTGAYRTGVLSCLVLEGAEAALLEPSGALRRWPEGSGLNRFGIGSVMRAIKPGR